MKVEMTSKPAMFLVDMAAGTKSTKMITAATQIETFIA